MNNCMGIVVDSTDVVQHPASSAGFPWGTERKFVVQGKTDANVQVLDFGYFLDKFRQRPRFLRRRYHVPNHDLSLLDLVVA